MLLLLSSLAALAAGPALIAVLHPEGRGRAALDAFVLLGVAGLILGHVMPEAIEAAGWPAGTAAACGVAFPSLLHRFWPEGTARANRGAAVLGILALLTHAMLDGVALRTSEPGGALALAVLLHRLPLGLSVWWLGLTVIGRRAAIAILATEGLGTVLGFSLGELALDALSHRSLPVFQVFMAGTVLHVVWGHGPHDRSPFSRHRWSAILGAALALGALAAVWFLE